MIIPFHLLRRVPVPRDDLILIEDSLPKSEQRWWELRREAGRWYGYKMLEDSAYEEQVPLSQKMTDLLVAWAFLQGQEEEDR